MAYISSVSPIYIYICIYVYKKNCSVFFSFSLTIRNVAIIYIVDISRKNYLSFTIYQCRKIIYHIILNIIYVIEMCIWSISNICYKYYCNKTLIVNKCHTTYLILFFFWNICVSIVVYKCKCIFHVHNSILFCKCSIVMERYFDFLNRYFLFFCLFWLSCFSFFFSRIRKLVCKQEMTIWKLQIMLVTNL